MVTQETIVNALPLRLSAFVSSVASEIFMLMRHLPRRRGMITDGDCLTSCMVKNRVASRIVKMLTRVKRRLAMSDLLASSLSSRGRRSGAPWRLCWL
jgi:hypothetical protein